MAIIFEGLSKCALCGKVLDVTKEYLGFPPLTNNKKDTLFIFSDSGVHAECLNGHPLAGLVYSILEAYTSMSIRRGCIVDGQIINDPDKMISFGLLTSDERQPLSKYNYTILNKDNLDRWDQRKDFVSIAKEFIDNGEWDNYGEFHSLKYLISIIDQGEYTSLRAYY